MLLVNGKRLSTIALFSGGGGLDLGFAAAGFDIRVSTDIDLISCATLEKNMRGRKRFFSYHPVITEDIANLSANELLKEGELSEGEVDIVIGGPPCQAFSVSGQRKGLADPRGKLILEFSRIIGGLCPQVFIFENVYGLASLHDGKVLKELKGRLSMEGRYKVDAQIYELAKYGIPQWRKRVFIVGSRIGNIFSRMPETHGKEEGLKPFRTVGEVLHRMPPPGNELANHRARAHGRRVIRRYQSMPFGKRDKYTRINRLDPKRPSYTIVVGSDKGGGTEHIHPYEPRAVTPRESARLQTFPDWWEFDGNVRHTIRQIGNAVPPLFAAQYASHIRRHVFGDKKPPTAKALAKKIGLDFLS